MFTRVVLVNYLQTNYSLIKIYVVTCIINLKNLHRNITDHVFRLFETNPEIREIFPTFKRLKPEEIMNSRSLHLHAKRVMGALENAVLALNDAEVFTEYLMNLGERHLPWSVKMEHFDVCIPD